ncbi:hypothetical protein N658DRAFT_511772 [Parathielavia hyrcaniae]|uniref:Uncharacterized protein n=1 Tax=Parathielavia hyrcaniae TaxID=113614 RepID=A0AAN6PRP2_9PEZI|nr:hypothetical protein N658DRAFT_511772 [Parathielavia hyrcaniae]
MRSKLLLGTGKVDVDAKDKAGRTPVSWAAENGYKAVVKLLLGTGSKINACVNVSIKFWIPPAVIPVSNGDI